MTFTLTPRKTARVSMFMRLSPDLIKRLNNLQKNTGINKSDIIEQALEYALGRLEVKK